MNNKTAARERLFLCIHFPMYRSATDSTPMQNTISRVNVFSERSPILYPMYPLPAISCIPEQNAILSIIVLKKRISFGMTTLQKSIIRMRNSVIVFRLCLN